LLLRHLDPHRSEVGEEGVAAQGPTTGAEAAAHARFVAHPVLVELDAGAQCARQIAHQGAEVHSPLGREVQHQAASVEGGVSGDELHGEAVLGDLAFRHIEGLPLPE
jgi:hypothetical protein